MACEQGALRVSRQVNIVSNGSYVELPFKWILCTIDCILVEVSRSYIFTL